MSDSPDSATKNLITIFLVVFFAALIAAFVDRTILTPITDSFVGRIKV